jgi:hypothetical protein
LIAEGLTDELGGRISFIIDGLDGRVDYLASAKNERLGLQFSGVVRDSGIS